MKSLIIVFANLLLIVATPFVFTALDDAKTQNYTENFAGVATAVATYTANVTVSRPIYNNDTTSFSTLSSNITSDAPSASAFNSVSRL